MENFNANPAIGFKAVQKAQEMVEQYTPIFDRIFARKESRTPFTVMQIGEEMMPNGAYHAKTVYYAGEAHRGNDQCSMTGMITAAVQSLVQRGILKDQEVKDLDHPYEVEFTGTYFVDQNGKVLPDTVMVTGPDGATYEVPSRYMSGVRMCRGKIKKPVYNTYTMYTFAD